MILTRHLNFNPLIRRATLYMFIRYPNSLEAKTVVLDDF